MLRFFLFPFWLVFFAFMPLAALQAGPSKLDWQLKRQVADLVIWQHRQSQSLRASSQWKEGRSKLLEQKEITEFVQKLEAQKNEGLNLTGVKDWKVESSNWDEKSKTLTLKGSYRDRKNTEVEFVELHCFEENSRSIHLITSKNGGSIKQDDVNSLLAQARTLGSPE